MTLPIDTSLMPASVQQAGPKAQQLYATALQFEQLLVQQLAQQLQDTTDPSGSSDGSSDGATSLYTQMLPSALAQGITNDGGLGLANELYQSLAAAQGISTTPAPTGQASPAAPAAPSAGMEPK